MDAVDSGDEKDYEPMSTEVLEDIRDGSQSCPNANRRESCYKIRDRIRETWVKFYTRCLRLL